MSDCFREGTLGGGARSEASDIVALEKTRGRLFARQSSKRLRGHRSRHLNFGETRANYQNEERSGFDRPASVSEEPDNPNPVFTRGGDPLFV